MISPYSVNTSLTPGAPVVLCVTMTATTPTTRWSMACLLCCHDECGRRGRCAISWMRILSNSDPWLQRSLLTAGSNREYTHDWNVSSVDRDVEGGRGQG